MKTLQERQDESLMEHPVYLLQMPGPKGEDGERTWDTVMVFLDGEEATEYMKAREYRFRRARVCAYPAGGCLRTMLDYDGRRLNFIAGRARYSVGMEGGELVVELDGQRMELGI